MRQGRALLLAIVLLIGGGTFAIRAGADPVIPHQGGIIVQSNVTGTFEDIVILSDDKFVTVGHTVGTTVSNGIASSKPIDGLLIKYRADGTFDWKTTLNFGQRDTFSSVIRDADNRVFVTGHTAVIVVSKGPPSWGRLAEYSSVGSLEWSTNFSVSGRHGTVLADSILDGDTLVSVGFTMTRHAPEVFTYHPLLVQTSKSGVVSSYQEFTSIVNATWISIQPGDAAGTYFVAGSRPGGPEDVQGCMGKVSSSYTVSWSVCDATYSHALLALATQSSKPTATGLYSEEDDIGQLYKVPTLTRESDGDFERALYYSLDYGNQGMGTAVLPQGTALIVSGFRNAEAYDIFGMEFDLAFKPTIFAIKYAANGDVSWETGYSDPTAYIFGTGAALNSDPDLLVVGMKSVFLALSPLSENPLVIRYESL